MAGTRIRTVDLIDLKSVAHQLSYAGFILAFDTFVSERCARLAKTHMMQAVLKNCEKPIKSIRLR